MDLEYKVILGILLIGGGSLLFCTEKLVYHTNKVKSATTKFLDCATNYFSRRASSSEDISSLAKLAKYRKECGI